MAEASNNQQGFYTGDGLSPAPFNQSYPQDPEGYLVQSDRAVTWTASEFIAHQKTASWYLTLTFSAIIVAAIVWLITKDTMSAFVIIAGAVALGIYAGRKPRTLQYELDAAGLHVGQSFFPYSNFRSFSVLQEGAVSSIVLQPLKRFSPLITLYYGPDDEDAILSKIMQFLPMEEGRHDIIDRLMQRIRF